MKECAKQKGKTVIRPDPSLSEDHSEIATGTANAMNGSSANLSM
jgi:hypothetical protein